MLNYVYFDSNILMKNAFIIYKKNIFDNYSYVSYTIEKHE